MRCPELKKAREVGPEYINYVHVSKTTVKELEVKVGEARSIML